MINNDLEFPVEVLHPQMNGPSSVSVGYQDTQHYAIGSEYYDKLRVNTETQAVMNVTFLTAPAVSYLAGILF